MMEANDVDLKERTVMKHWHDLPLAMRQRWWEETDYGHKKPTPELIRAMFDSLSGKK